MPETLHHPAAGAPAVGLAEQLACTARLVQAVQKGRSLTDAVVGVPMRLRPGVQALTFDALRRLGLTRAIVRLLSARPPVEPVHSLLCVAIGLLLDTPDASGRSRYGTHTVVDQAVRALKPLKQPVALAGFVNACLRRFLREQPALIDQATEQTEARWNHPAWWVDRLKQDHPLHWQALLEADQQPAPMVLRVNRRRGSRAAYLSALQDLGVPAVAWGEDAIQLQEAMPVERLPGWADGAVSVQDGAAQLAASLLMGDGLGIRRVLDACAAPGGKTAHLLEWAQTDLLALDKDARRCERIRENLDRLRLNAEVKVADAGETANWWDGRPFDAILLDAPCTASGIVRRHPDVRWLRRPSDVTQLVEQQKRLLEALWPLLRSGGRLLYCTCSVFRAEGEQQIQAFLDRHADALRLPAPGHLLTGLAGAQPVASSEDPFSDNRWRGTDGFFYGLLQRQS